MRGHAVNLRLAERDGHLLCDGQSLPQRAWRFARDLGLIALRMRGRAPGRGRAGRV